MTVQVKNKSGISYRHSSSIGHVLEYSAGWPIRGIGDRLFHGVYYFEHQVPISGREVAWQLLLDRYPNIIR